MFNLATISVPHSKRTLPPKLNSHVHTYSNDIHNLATLVLLSQQIFTVLFFLVKSKTMGDEPDLATKLCAKALFSNWRKLFSKSLVVKKVLDQETWHKVIFPCTGKSSRAEQNSFRQLLEVVIAHCDSKQRHWISHARSDFWQEKSRGGSPLKEGSMQVVDLSALAMLASITNFILRCFQFEKTNGAGAGWSWWETTPPQGIPQPWYT